jgi:cysteine-rich repeat protein
MPVCLGLALCACFEDVGGNSEATGDGDGDGDPSTGDGDGDPSGDGDGDPSTGDGDGDPTGDGDGDCSSAGCECSDPGQPCDDGLYCSDGGLCTAPTCGDSQVEPLEQCDDGNTIDGDGCDADCSFTEVLAVDASFQNTCALLEGGRVRCWGKNNLGQLGYGHSDDIGDDETPASAGDVMLPAPGVQLTMGDSHSCILMADMAVRCWGEGSSGKLGYGNTENIGDDEFPINIPDVALGGAALEVDAGGSHTCARLNDGKARCWGAGFGGQLGYGNPLTIGDDESPASAGDVPIGAAIVSMATGINHTCAITATGAIRCWGSNYSGQLGYGHLQNIGDDETPASAGNVSAIPLGLPANTKASALALGFMTCALYQGGAVLCWGPNLHGQLGQGNTTMIGDDELPSTIAAIPLPAPAVAITAGDNHVCALLDTHEAICWGANLAGQLGYGHTDNLGDDETLDTLTPLALGGPVKQIDAGGDHTCAILAETNQVLCWGQNSDGQLGYGHTDNIGDDELPVSAGAIELF